MLCTRVVKENQWKNKSHNLCDITINSPILKCLKFVVAIVPKMAPVVYSASQAAVTISLEKGIFFPRLKKVASQWGGNSGANTDSESHVQPEGLTRSLWYCGTELHWFHLHHYGDGPPPTMPSPHLHLWGTEGGRKEKAALLHITVSLHSKA